MSALPGQVVTEQAEEFSFHGRLRGRSDGEILRPFHTHWDIPQAAGWFDFMENPILWIFHC